MALEAVVTELTSDLSIVDGLARAPVAAVPITGLSVRRLPVNRVVA